MNATTGHPHCGPDKAPRGPGCTHTPPGCGPTSRPHFLVVSGSAGVGGTEGPQERRVTEAPARPPRDPTPGHLWGPWHCSFTAQGQAEPPPSRDGARGHLPGHT